MKILYSAKARIDLNEIGLFIAEDNPGRAETFVLELRHACEKLTQAPFASPLVPRHEDIGIRRRPFRRYLIFYTVEKDAIMIVRILHGARDYAAILFDNN